ncbi:hypothetical protein [Tsuneonella mangrovi]|uniref:hypothetical protein n=1 Tax=Tsuneonella mangrovi TaxID=1982042 RepID=UPI000BA1D164|nr:hypothetical protein [Tsuneonella mangrovi]
MKSVARLVLLALLALVAVFAELDRQSARDPALATYVPAPFRSFALDRRAADAIDRHDKAAAMRNATVLLRHRPIPARNLYLYARASQLDGNKQAFAQAFLLGTQRGWRVEPLQFAAAQLALVSGNPSGAANRVAALWATNRNYPGLDGLTRQLLATGGGLQAFAGDLAATRVWQASFLGALPRLVPATEAARLLVASSNAGLRLPCTQRDAIISHYRSRSGPAAAVQVVMVPCE